MIIFVFKLGVDMERRRPVDGGYRSINEHSYEMTRLMYVFVSSQICFKISRAISGLR
jgi:hypothetical protein